MSGSTVIDTSSPLYLHPSEGSGSVSVTTLQGSSNYRAWKRSMEIALTSKRKSVNDYFTQLQVLWEEFENLSVFPSLTTMNAEITAYVNFKQKQQEEMKLFQFLNGLDDINGPIRTNILMQSVLPNVSEACRIISQEESQREVCSGIKEGEGLTMLTKSSTSLSVCATCGKTGHVKEKCWTVVGYPPWFNKQNDSKGKEKEQYNTQNNYYRGGRGGRSNRGGRFNRGGGRMAANVQAQRENSSTQASNTHKESGIAGTGVTP
ncbi:N-acetylmuramic acid 6-phosphate etherase [Bienertia sinuspersici]